MSWIRKLAGSEVSTINLRVWEFAGSALVNLFVFILVAAYLSPLSFTVITSLKNAEQLQDPTSPIYPAVKITYEYEGKDYSVVSVPIEGQGVQEWALVNRFRQYSEFIDPQHPEQRADAGSGSGFRDCARCPLAAGGGRSRRARRADHTRRASARERP